MFNQYPYLNLNDLNLDYILNEIKSMYNDVTNFVSINAIKYADPIQWNITQQYEKNTVVIDPLTGTAYISVAAVPSGVALTRTEYWTVVFDLGSFVTRAAQNFTSRWESDTTTTATFSTSTGDWLVWGDVLYKALTNITAGDTYVVGSNIEHFTIEDLYNAYLNTIAQILAMIGDLVDLNTTDKTNLVAAINEVIVTFTGSVADEVQARQDADAALQNQIEELSKSNIFKISSIENINTQAIQNAINNYDVIDFDVNVELGSESLQLRSNTEIFSSNGSTIKGRGRIFTLEGSADNSSAVLTFTDKTHGTYSGNLDNGSNYVVMSTTNALNSSLGYPFYMGGGTELNTEAYPTIFTPIYIDSANNFVTEVPTYGLVTTANAHKLHAIHDVHLHDLHIDGRENNTAYLIQNAPISLCYTINCQLDNIDVIVGSGNCFTIAASADIKLSGCNAAVENLTFIDHYYNNVFRIAGGYNVVLDGCSGTGSQPYDITYRKSEKYCSANCIIKNCVSNANYTCLTLHPGTWGCTIDSLTGYCIKGNSADGISARGSLHTIKNCILYGANETGSYGLGSVEGSLCHTFKNNTVLYFDYCFYLQETSSYRWTSGGSPFVHINDNEFIRCANGIHIEQSDNTSASNIAPYLSFINNIISRDNSTLNNANLIYISGNGTRAIQFITIDCIVVNKTFSQLLANDTTGLFRRSDIKMLIPYALTMDKSYTGNISEVHLSIKGSPNTITNTSGNAIPSLSELNV